MMTIEEMEKKLAEIDDLRKKADDLCKKLDEQIAELKKLEEEKPKPPHPRWKPKGGTQYYTINIGNACTGINTWTDDNIDGSIYSLGFVFKTEAEAEFAIERLKVLAEMQEWAGKWDGDFVIVYSGEDNDIGVSDLPLPQVTYGIIRFASRKDAENCIRAVGADRIIKYYFEISREEKK